MTRFWLTVSVAVAAGVALAAQKPADLTPPASKAAIGNPAATLPMRSGTAVVSGQVTEGDSNTPVPKAIVTISLPGVEPVRVMADGEGPFGLRNLPAGRFDLTAERAGWAPGAYGRTRPGGPQLSLPVEPDDRVSNITIPMWRFAVITGTVIDEGGSPVVNASVRVFKQTLVSGRYEFRPVAQDWTDDRGLYRVGTLEPGNYAVAVPMPQRLSKAAEDKLAAEAAKAGKTFEAGPSAGMDESGRVLSYATLFYPNATTSARATPIAVASGEERAEVNFRLRGVPTSTVSGTVTGTGGRPLKLQITLVPADDDNVSSVDTLTVWADAQGRFTAENVPPGQYKLRVLTATAAVAKAAVAKITVAAQLAAARLIPPPPAESILWADQTLTVGTTNLDDVTVALQPGVRLSGLLQFNGSSARPAPAVLESLELVLEPAEPRPGVGSAPGRVASSGQFNMMAVAPGKYFVRVSRAYPGWTFHSATLNGRDASDVAIDIDADQAGVVLTFTDQPSELSGSVTSDGPVEAATVLVFPAEPSVWTGYGSAPRRFRSVRANAEGRFSVSNLPGGAYLAVAIPDRMANDWQSPVFLESIASSATRLIVRDGERVTASLNVVR